MPLGKWGGQVLITHRVPGGRYERFTAEVPSTEVHRDTAKADLQLSRSMVRQRNGVYYLRAHADGPGGVLDIDMNLVPTGIAISSCRDEGGIVSLGLCRSRPERGGFREDLCG